MIALLVTAICQLGGVNSDSVVPESLAKAIDRRMSFRTAYFEYTYEGEAPGLWRSPKHRYEARFAHRDIYWTEFGGDDGAVLRDPKTGAPLLGVAFACSPIQTVRCNEGKEEWSIPDGRVVVSARPTRPRMRIGGRAPEMFLDPRSAGLDVMVCSETSPSEFLEDQQGYQLSWSEKMVDGFIEVTASSPTSGSSESPSAIKVWRIDPKKDYSIVRIGRYSVTSDGSRRLIKQLETTLQEVDGRWWPKRCETKFDQGGFESIEFTKVEFDHKGHPSVLGPNILGIPKGLNAIDRIHYDPANGPLKIGRYIGNGEVVSVSEWDQKYSAEFDPAPLQAFIARAHSLGYGQFPQWWNAGEETLGLRGVEHEPDQWEIYVRRWITRHSYEEAPKAHQVSQLLSESQIAAAWAILKDCRHQAEPIVARMEKEVTASQPTAAKNTGPTPPRFQSELEKIFAALRVRLNGLLTKRQQTREKSANSMAVP